MPWSASHVKESLSSDRAPSVERKQESHCKATVVIQYRDCDRRINYDKNNSDSGEKYAD